MGVHPTEDSGWNGEWRALMVRVPNDKPAQALNSVRQDANGKLFAVFNLSDRPQSVRFGRTLFHGDCTSNNSAVNPRHWTHRPCWS